MNRKEYLKKWREDNKQHIRNYKKEYAKTHDSSFKKMQDKYKQLQQENKQLKATIELYKGALKSEHEATHRANDLEDNWNELKNSLKELYKRCPTYERGALKFMRDKMQELEKKYKNLWEKEDSDE